MNLARAHRRIFLTFAGLLVCALAHAQTPTPQQTAPQEQSKSADSPESDTPSIFPHSESSRFWLSGQANVIFQWHPAFPAKYSGPQKPSRRGGKRHLARFDAVHRRGADAHHGNPV